MMVVKRPPQPRKKIDTLEAEPRGETVSDRYRQQDQMRWQQEREAFQRPRPEFNPSHPDFERRYMRKGFTAHKNPFAIRMWR